MSIRAWGGFDFEDEAALDEKMKFAFEATKVASENEIGIILGWNVSSDLREEFRNASNILPFEIVDDPTTNIAEELFSGDGVRLFVEHKRVDKGETLDSRMTRVQRFLQQVLQIKTVKGVILHVSEGFGEEVVLETSVDGFKDKILGMYTHGRTWTPTVKFILNK